MELQSMFNNQSLKEKVTYEAYGTMSINDEEAKDPKVYQLTKKQMFELLAGKNYEQVKLELIKS